MGKQVTVDTTTQIAVKNHHFSDIPEILIVLSQKFVGERCTKTDHDMNDSDIGNKAMGY